MRVEVGDSTQVCERRTSSSRRWQRRSWMEKRQRRRDWSLLCGREISGRETRKELDDENSPVHPRPPTNLRGNDLQTEQIAKRNVRRVE